MTINTKLTAASMTVALAAGALATGAIASGAETAPQPPNADFQVTTEASQTNVATTLSTSDRDGLAFMREEEKLAHDVYLAMYDIWGTQIFSNIAGAEQTHTQAVATMLAQYGIDDPAATRGHGEFTDPTLQTLYDDLVERGSESATEALLVGALIEETDIRDLQERASTNPSIAQLYASLERGSENHLRAFVRQLDGVGVTYEPTILSQSEFDEIVSAAGGSGNAARGRSDRDQGRNSNGGHTDHSQSGNRGGGQGHSGGSGSGRSGNGH